MKFLNVKRAFMDRLNSGVIKAILIHERMSVLPKFVDFYSGKDVTFRYNLIMYPSKIKKIEISFDGGPRIDNLGLPPGHRDPIADDLGYLHWDLFWKTEKNNLFPSASSVNGIVLGCPEWQGTMLYFTKV